MTQHCASLTHFAFGADLITQSDSIKYYIFDRTIAYISYRVFRLGKPMVKFPSTDQQLWVTGIRARSNALWNEQQTF